MATATGDVAYNFAAAADENPWSLADGGVGGPFVVRNGMTARIITNALRSNFNSNGYCCYVAQAIDQNDFEVKGETLQSSGEWGDQVGVGAINSSGNGYILWINGNLWRIYQIDAFVIGDGTNLNLSHTALDVISLQYSYSGGTATLTAKQNGSTVGLSVVDSTSPYNGDLQPCWFFNFDNSNAGGFRSIAFDGLASATPTIDTIGTIRPGQSVSITTTGLGTLTTATTIGGKNITSASAPSGDGTITAADFVSGQTYPPMGTVTVIASDGTDTATNTGATIATYSDHLTVTLATPFDTSEFSLYGAWPAGDPPQAGEVVHYPNDGTGLVNANLSLTSFAEGVHTFWVRRYDGIMYSFDAEISAAGVTPSYKIGFPQYDNELRGGNDSFPDLVFYEYFEITQATGYSIALESGSFALSGQALNLTASRLISADSGSYSITGGDLNFTVSKVISCEAGPFSVTGGSASLITSRRITLDSGSLSLSGQDASIIASRRISADSGLFAAGGQDMDFVYTPVSSYSIICDGGSFAVNGQDASIRLSAAIQANSSLFSLSGQDSSIRASRLFQLSGGAYSLTGQAASILASRIIGLSSGGLTVIGGNTGVISSLRIAIESGSYGLTGYDLTFTYSGDYVIPTEFFPYVIVSVDPDYQVSLDRDFSVKIDRDYLVGVTHGV